MRTKRQSSRGRGDAPTFALKGNHSHRQRRAASGESLLDLCRKVYFLHRRTLFKSLVSHFIFVRSISLENDARQSKDSKASPKKAKKSFWKLVNWKWVITAFLSSLSISMVLSLLSSEGLNYLNIFCSCLVLVFFVALGVIFDIIGLAVATADSKPFLAMAARKVRAGKTAVKLIKKCR